MMIPTFEDRRWTLARQMGVTCAIAKLAPELTGKLPPWDMESLSSEVERYRRGGFAIVGLEGDQFDMSRIKFGLPGREEDIERYRLMLSNMGELGIGLLCFNFMAGVGWHRTDVAVPTRGNAMVSRFRASDSSNRALTSFGETSEAQIWENFAYFIKSVAPAAEAAGVRMGLHPDDPPVSPLRGIGRVLTSVHAMERALAIADSPSVGVTFCQGTISTMGENPINAVRRFGKDSIAFVHVRDVRGDRRDFVETFPDDGQTDMPTMIATYQDMGLDCFIRPDHAPAMDGDPVHTDPVVGMSAGYEANGMIFATAYLKGLLDANRRAESRTSSESDRNPRQ